jgi:hypothetical protein
MPAAVMVPVRGVPPAMALTLQETVVSAAPVTVAEKVCVFPRRSEAEAGVMATVTDEGGGGGITAELAPEVLPAQPAVLATAARRTRAGSAARGECAGL